MGTYLRRTPALLDVLDCLLGEESELWGLRISQLAKRPTGTVYPLLERLETERFVASRWEDDCDRSGPRRRLYSLTDAGRSWAANQVESRHRTSGESSR